MSDKNTEIFCFGITVLIMIIVVMLIYLSLRKHDNDKESFKKCICSGTTRTCQDNDNVKDSYESGLNTEFSDRKSRGWSTVSPGDANFPVIKGCVSNADLDATVKMQDTPEWISWDFTDF